jgi:hypothetical protein
LLVAAVLLMIVLARRSPSQDSLDEGSPSQDGLDDECPLDRLNSSRRSDGSAGENAQDQTDRQAANEPAPLSLEDRVDPALLPSVRKLSSTMPHVVAEGVKELGESGDMDTVPLLVAALHTHHRSVYFGVVNALLRLGPPCVGRLREELAKERDAELGGLVTRLLEQLDRKAKGLEPAPVEDIVGMSSEVRDEVAKGYT